MEFLVVLARKVKQSSKKVKFFVKIVDHKKFFRGQIARAW